MTSSLLQGKKFFCREWAFSKISSCLESRKTAKTCGALIMGGPGSGKTALCCELVWPSVAIGKQVALNKKLLAYYFCQAHDIETLSIGNFIHSLVEQLSKSSLIQGYNEQLASNNVQTVLDLDQCEKDPDEAFRLTVLEPLNAIKPPPQTLFLVFDSIDESYFQSISERATSSRTIAELLSNHQQLFPPWLLLLCSARRQSKSVTRLFTGFRKISLDDLRKSYIVRDVQQYILCRLDEDEHLQQQSQHLSKETAEMLNQLHIKSNGCFLYMERVLDGVAEAFIILREIREIPGTLNGLYLWLCQRIFDAGQFEVVRPVINVILAARRPLTEAELYSCTFTRNTNLQVEDFHKQLNILSKVLIEGKDGTKILFHHSFAEWLLDVKHCTQKYLCHASEGHAMLALSFTMHAPTLSPVEIQDFALHISKSNLSQPFSQVHSALWLLHSGAGISDCLQTNTPKEETVTQLLLEVGASAPLAECLSTKSLKDVPLQNEALATLLESGMALDSIDSSSRTLLHLAANEGNTSAVQKALEKGASVIAQDNAGHTPLSLAARQGYATIAVDLIQAGSDVNHTDAEGWSVLRSAAWGGHMAVVTILLEKGAKVDQPDNEGRTALRAAAWGGHTDIVQALIAAGADVNSADVEGRTPLIAAAYMGHPVIVSKLLKAGAKIDHQDLDCRTALSVAALCMPATTAAGRHATVISTLLEWGAEVDHEDRDGMTPLLVAAYEGHYEVCDLLLESDAEVDHMDQSGRGALQAAVSMGHAHVVSLLLFWGCAVDQMDPEGRTVLCLACQQGNGEVVQQLLARGLDEMHRDNSGWTPLHFAAFEGHREAVELLLECGAKVTEIDNEGRIPLLLAAQEGHLEMVKRLLEARSPLQSKAHDGRTPLRAAVLEGHRQVSDYLADEGADLNYKDSDGRSALYVVALENQLETAESLLQHQADVESADLEGRTPLHVASWQGHVDMVKLLLKHCAAVNGMDTECRTALQSAAWQGHAKVVLILLDAGARVDHTCSQGATALCIAAQEGHLDVVKVLLKYNANPNHADQCGRTAAKVALKSGHEEILHLLEQHGAVLSGGSSVAERRTKAMNSSSTSGISTATTDCTGNLNSTSRGCSSMVRLRPPSALIQNKAYDSSFEGTKLSEVSNQSSGNITSNTASTDQSSGSANQGDIAPKVPMGLSFTQQLQQCSSRGGSIGSGSRVHHPLSQTLTPGSELNSSSNYDTVAMVTSPMSDVQPCGSPYQPSKGSASFHLYSPHSSYSSSNNSHSNSSQRLPTDAPVWQRQGDGRQGDGRLLAPLQFERRGIYQNVTLMSSSTTSSGSPSVILHSPSDTAKQKQRNGILTNPKFTKSATSPGLCSPPTNFCSTKLTGVININGYINHLASIPDSKFPDQRGLQGHSNGKPVRPTGLPLKRETPL